MAPPPRTSLVHALLTLCDDVLFTILATLRLDPDTLRAFGKRRAQVVAAVARGAIPEEIGQGDPWIVRLTATSTPIAPPRFLPMADVIDEGVSLELGARGVRSLFTNKPSEKDAARVRAVGAFALRALTAVLASTGSVKPEALVARSAFAASLGLPDDEQRAMLDEPPTTVELLELPPGIEPKLARAVLRGAFFAAMFEGSDPREEQAVLLLGRKTGLPAEDITAAHGEARLRVDAGRAFGEACMDALKAVLGEDGDELAKVASVVARLTLPAPDRTFAWLVGADPKGIDAGAIIVAPVGGAGLGAPAPGAPPKKYAIDRRAREAALGLVWASALRSNPSYVRRAELAVKHDKAAADLGEEGAGAEARRMIEAWLDEEMRAAVPLAPPPMPHA